MAPVTRLPLTFVCFFTLYSSLVNAALTLKLTSHVLNAAQVEVMRTHAQRVGDIESNKLLRRATYSQAATNRYSSYTASVGIGSGGQTYNLLIDTGSANTWAKNYTLTSSSVDTGYNVSVTYGLGKFSGREYTDTIKLAGATISNTGVGRATAQTYFDYIDGILGIGPAGLTRCTVSGNNCATVPTVIDTLKAQGTISANVVGIQFTPVETPYTSQGVTNGKMTIGGVDMSAIRSKIIYTPITTRSPARAYMGIDITRFLYRPANYTTPIDLVKSSAATPVTRSGITDTGTTMTLIPDDVFTAYMAQLPGSFINSAGFLQIPNAQVPLMGNLTMTIGGLELVMTPSAQLFPPAAASAFGNNDSRYATSILASSGGINTGDDFTLGMTWLTRFYSINDLDNRRMGFALTPDTYTRTHPLAKPWTPTQKSPKVVPVPVVLKAPKITATKAKKAAVVAAGLGRHRLLMERQQPHAVNMGKALSA